MPSPPGTVISDTASLGPSTDESNSTHNNSSTLTISVDQGTPAVRVSDAGGPYNGNPYPASATALGVDGKPLDGSFSYTYYAGSSASGMALSTAPTNAGTYTVVAVFTSSDPNYTNGAAQTTFTITPPPPPASGGGSAGVTAGCACNSSATVANEMMQNLTTYLLHIDS